MRDLRTELREHRGFAPTWQPEVGDMIVGLVREFSVAPGQYGDVNVVTIHDEETDEDWAVWLSSTVLLNEFQRLEPKVGERIGIRYDGKVLSKNSGNSYHRYLVKIDREDADLRERGGETSPAPEAAPKGVGTLPLKAPAKKTLLTVADDDEIPF